MATPELHRWLQRVAAQRSGPRNGRQSPLDVLVTSEEILQNRAALVTAGALTAQRSTSVTVGTGDGKFSNRGKVPLRVANCTYSGTAEDQALGQQILKQYTKYIMTPGVAETSWANFKDTIHKAVGGAQLEGKAFPEAIQVGSMRGCKSEMQGRFGSTARFDPVNLKKREASVACRISSIRI